MRLTAPPSVPSWNELAEGMSASVEFAVTADEMRRFADLSGDYNPLHLDTSFARAKGFDGVVVYGGLLIAKVSQLIGMKLPGRDAVWIGLSLQFSKPLYVGQPAQLEGTIANLSEATRIVGLRIVLRSAGQVLATGKAEVLLVEQ
jgi:3-hydroxybutyryl-CoA dehydratase